MHACTHDKSHTIFRTHSDAHHSVNTLQLYYNSIMKICDILQRDITFQRCSLKCGHWSMTAVQMASIPPNCEPMPSMSIIKKNRIAHKCGIGIRSTASGYAMKAKPGPDWTTSATGTFRLCAIKPIIEKTAKPAKIAVKTFVADTTNVSMWQLCLNCNDDVVNNWVMSSACDENMQAVKKQQKISWKMMEEALLRTNTNKNTRSTRKPRFRGLATQIES